MRCCAIEGPRHLQRSEESNWRDLKNARISRITTFKINTSSTSPLHLIVYSADESDLQHDSDRGSRNSTQHREGSERSERKKSSQDNYELPEELQDLCYKRQEKEFKSWTLLSLSADDDDGMRVWKKMEKPSRLTTQKPRREDDEMESRSKREELQNDDVDDFKFLLFILYFLYQAKKREEK